MSDWQPHAEKEAALREIETKIALEPEKIEHQFQKALHLTELGRLVEAKQVYVEILRKQQNQFAALNNLGAILSEMGFPSDAGKVYREVIARFPEQAAGHVNLAWALYKTGNLAEAREQYEATLRIEPDHVRAHQGLAHLLTELNDEEAARPHLQKGYGDKPWVTMPYRGKKKPVRLLSLVSARGGNSPIDRFFDNTVFETTKMVADFYAGATPLPDHDLVVNVVGDAERAFNSLDAVDRILKLTDAPALNLPGQVRETTREGNARRLGLLEGVKTPHIAVVARKTLMGSDAEAELEKRGFTFPLLVRALGFQGGDHFVKVESLKELPAKIADIPGTDLLVIEFLDARSSDGKIRKYRVMTIGGKLIPLHCAVSNDWKIHFFSALMADFPEHRAEDEAFIQNMPEILGPRAMLALQRISDALGLDYGGMDFGISLQGDVILFEANATMMIPNPKKGAEWDYRRAHVKRVQENVREMILAKAR